MILPDVNVLIYAHREESPDHASYASWLRRVAARAGVALMTRIVFPPAALAELFKKEAT